MGKWLFYNAPTLQAVCAILGIIGLAIYAWDTRKIRVATLAQSEATRRPFFKIRYGITEYGRRTYRIKNVGVGIALNTEWSFIKDPDICMPIRVGDSPPGSVELLTDPWMGHIEWDQVDISSRGGFNMTYCDTAGIQYWQKFVMTSSPHGVLIVHYSGRRDDRTMASQWGASIRKAYREAKRDAGY